MEACLMSRFFAMSLSCAASNASTSDSAVAMAICSGRGGRGIIMVESTRPLVRARVVYVLVDVIWLRMANDEKQYFLYCSSRLLSCGRARRIKPLNTVFAGSSSMTDEIPTSSTVSDVRVKNTSPFRTSNALSSNLVTSTQPFISWESNPAFEKRPYS